MITGEFYYYLNILKWYIFHKKKLFFYKNLKYISMKNSFNNAVKGYLT